MIQVKARENTIELSGHARDGTGGSPVAQYTISPLSFNTITYDHIQSYCYFYNYDGSELIYTETCLDGADASYSSKPSRASTAQYTYTFAGWATTPNGSADSNALKAITADRNVYAAYTATVRTYTVYFYNGSMLLQTVQNVAYGSSASYTGGCTIHHFSPVIQPPQFVFAIHSYSIYSPIINICFIIYNYSMM